MWYVQSGDSRQQEIKVGFEDTITMTLDEVVYAVI